MLLPDGIKLDVSAAFTDYDEAFFASDGVTRLRAWVEINRSSATVVEDAIRLGSPIARPSKLICIGLNYRDHAAELQMAIPTEPIVFFQSTTALTGPYDGVIIPFGSEKTDWEVELAVVIGKLARRMPLDRASAHVAWYVLHNDYSERAWQLERGGQWVKGKSADTFAPLGPWLATTDKIPNPGDLKLWLDVNGVRKQDGHTGNLIFDVPFLVYYLSQFMTLLLGDVISTGTPAGVRPRIQTPAISPAGDVVELGIASLGTQRQLARAQSQDASYTLSLD